MQHVYWCAFGLSTASTGDMFPADVTAVVQSTGPSYFLEDRDSYIGYRSPPCYAKQLSYLLSASTTNGTLSASWTRPLTLDPTLLSMHYQDIRRGPLGMTLIAASSADTSAAAQRCAPQMVLHTYCIPGIKVVFPAAEVAAPLPFDGVLRAWGDGTLGAFLAPPLPGNHASFLELLPSGALVAAWFSGGEGQPGCGIAVAVLPAGGAQFSPGRLVSVRPSYSNQNPVLFADTAASPPLLHLFHTSQATGPGGGENTSVILHLTSSDGGAAEFSPPTLFYGAPGAFTRGGVVPLPGGGLMLPAYMSIEGTDYSFALRRAAATGPWVPVNLSQSGDLIQPAVVRLPSGAVSAGAPGSLLRAFLRDEDAIAIYAADSADEGATWGLPTRTVLPNNNAGISARVLRSGAVVMAYNDHAGTDAPRAPLVLSLSSDAGASWPCTRVLQAHDANSSSVGEYSYPALAEDGEGSVWVSYTYNRDTIVVRKLTEAWVREGC